MDPDDIMIKCPSFFGLDGEYEACGKWFYHCLLPSPPPFPPSPSPTLTHFPTHPPSLPSSLPPLPSSHLPPSPSLSLPSPSLLSASHLLGVVQVLCGRPLYLDARDMHHMIQSFPEVFIDLCGISLVSVYLYVACGMVREGGCD